MPEDVAQAVLFLASESASWIIGITLDVGGRPDHGLTPTLPTHET
jgi:NAD(P)-dependent dehydrogenase (short-subunit alcohol dehydrogenase family)